jgi:hypothetical protein
MRSALSGAILLSLIAMPREAASRERFEVDAFWGLSTLDVSETLNARGAIPFDTTFAQVFQLGARFVVHLGDRVGLEASYRYSPNGTRTTRFDDPFFGPTVLIVPSDLESHAFMGSVLYDVRRWERWRLFVSGGAGVERFDDEKGQNALTASFGGGSRFLLRDGLGIRVDARYVVWPSFYMTERTEGALELHAGLAIGF